MRDVSQVLRKAQFGQQKFMCFLSRIRFCGGFKRNQEGTHQFGGPF